MMDCQEAGSSLTGDGKAAYSHVVTDPASVFKIRSTGDRASVGQWVPPVDPATLGAAIRDFERDLLIHFGLNAGDIQSKSTSSRESGISLAIKRESIRQAQDRFEPQFRRGDLHLLKIISTLDKGVPETGWSVSYPGPRRTIDEIRQMVERHEISQRAGLTSPVDGMMELHPELTREDAAARVRMVRDEMQTLTPRTP
jgi:hypothetical protein